MAKKSNKSAVKATAKVPIKKTVKIIAKKTFSPLDYIASHPANTAVVNRIMDEIKAYITGYCQNAKIAVVFSDWYVGISQDPDNARTSGHKNRKGLTELTAYKRFGAYTLSNAREVEKSLCCDFKLNNCKTIGKVTEKTKYCYTYHLAGSPRK